jgi:hypothetical protein
MSIQRLTIVNNVVAIYLEVYCLAINTKPDVVFVLYTKVMDIQWTHLYRNAQDE